MSWHRGLVRTRFCKWLDAIVAAGLPPAAIKGLYFGLYEGMDGIGLYLTGAKGDAAQPGDWVRNEDWTPGGETRYLSDGMVSAEFVEFYDKFYAGNARGTAYAQVSLEMAHIIASGDYDALFAGRVVAMGFVDEELQWLRDETGNLPE